MSKFSVYESPRPLDIPFSNLFCKNIFYHELGQGGIVETFQQGENTQFSKPR